MASVLSTSRLKNVKTDLTTTNATTVYTCPALTVSVIQSMLVSEDSGNADAITVTIQMVVMCSVCIKIKQ